MGQLQFKERARSLEWLRREAEALSMRDELEAEELEGPALVKFVSSPHRYHHFDIIWTQPTDGLFFHFNNFRYSDSSRGENDQLKNLLPKLIERCNT